MWRSDGPEASACRWMATGIVGLRYFIRGSISRQKCLWFLSVAVLLWCVEPGLVVSCSQRWDD
jgi:hypothetical protein